MRRFIFNGSSIKEFKAKILTEHADIIGFDSNDLDPIVVWKSIPPEYHYMIFTKAELEFDITANVMVKKHEIDNPDNHPDKDRYPTILSWDPMVRVISAKLGDVIKIPDNRNKYYYRTVRSF